MPVTYSFKTPFVTPVDAIWTCLAFGAPNIENILSGFPAASFSRGAPWFSTDAVANTFTIYSDDGVLSSFSYELAISNTFTFQTSFVPSLLPDDLSDLTTSRFFIAVYNKQGAGAGLLLSKQGLAVVDAPGVSASVLPGSFGVIPESSSSYTLRLVVDGNAGLLYIYVTKTSELAATGHVLQYTSALLPTPLNTPDSLQIQILGQAAKPVSATFSTLLLNCSTALIPNKRPIADPGADQTANIGAAVSFDGSQSYDPEGQPLTYFWRLRSAPDGSKHKSSGVGATSPDGGGDGFTTILDGGASAFSVENMPLLQPGDHILLDSVYYRVSSDRWAASLSGYTRDVSNGWVDNEIVVTEDVLPDALSGAGFTVLHSHSFFSDQETVAPFAIPDVSGLYEIDLVVNDGELDSEPTEALANISQTSVAMGCTPNVSFIWDYLSDFWNQLEDREVVETVWGGFAQACAAQLLTLWQYDYSKSLKDIERVFQRRWLNYSTLLEETAPSETSVKIIRAPLYSGAVTGGKVLEDLTLQVVFDAGDIETVTFFGAGTLTPQTIATQINDQLGYTNAQTKLVTVVTEGVDDYLRFSYGALLQIRPGGTANTDLGFSTAEYTQNSLTGASGEGVDTYAFQANDVPTWDFDEEGIDASDLLVVNDVGYRVVKVALESGPSPTEKRGITTKDALPGTFSGQPWELPSVLTSTSLDFTDELVGAGDIARFEVKAAGQVPLLVQCTVRGAVEDRLGFDAAPLLSAYNGKPEDFSTKFLGVQRVNNIPVDSLVVEIPRLQEIIACPPDVLTQNIDYTVGLVGEQNAIRFTSGLFSITDPPPEELWAETTYLDNRYSIEDNFGRMVGFKVEDLDSRTDDLDYLSAVRGLWWSYFGGPSLAKVRTGVQILLGLPFAEEAGTINEIDPGFSATEGRIVIRDAANADILRAYYYPLTAGLGTNPATEATYIEGDEVAQFDPLTGGIEVADYVSDPLWLQRYVGQSSLGQLELDKFFKFLVRGDVDTFSLANLVFAIDFVKKIKPHYTYPIFSLLKNVPGTEQDVIDVFSIDGFVYLFDTPCPTTPGAYRWDDTDESGNYNHAYDDGVAFYDSRRLCPGESLSVLMSDTLSAGPWVYDSLWAYDDGDTDGVGGTDDLVPLSGPSPTPYGTPVGTITYDASITAGKYWRHKTL